jgi:TolB-like protein
MQSRDSESACLSQTGPLPRKELGIRDVLEGSGQREQNRVRVNAQLVDAESGADL